ncbi:MAG: response regulator [Halovenus sp.]|uniref:response regulator n=1 Tax=Halovenus amylolytica TaxID=2500550 RepID=UPI002FC41943
MTDELSADSEHGPASVLIIEDETELADMYAAYLPDDYDVEIADGGEAGLETLDDEYDLVLLDRRMPVVSGNEVLAAIEKRNLDCRVAMVTAVNPDFDIIDLRIDDYLVKPVTRAELTETVRRLLKLDEYNDRVNDLTSKKLKRNVLEVEKTQAELADNPEFERLNREIADLEQEVDELATELDIEDDGPTA